MDFIYAFLNLDQEQAHAYNIILNEVVYKIFEKFQDANSYSNLTFSFSYIYKLYFHCMKCINQSFSKKFHINLINFLTNNYITSFNNP